MFVNVMFGSDNHSGVHPQIMNEINTVNKGFFEAYGEDNYTKKTKDVLRKKFGSNSEVFFVGNGTAANILGLKAVTSSFNSIICPETAHLNVHECCGPEKFLGCKITTIPTNDGKLTVDLVKNNLEGFNDVHMAQPKVISITQATETGTVYTCSEIKKLSSFAHKNNLLIHMDGARLCNAAVYLNKNLKEITDDVGVDVLSFGGTKNGMMFGDAVVFFDKKLSENFEFYRKQGMHLTSKMRFISAQFKAFFKDDLWLKNAQHANKMAQMLNKKLKDVSELEVIYKVEANAVFVKIPTNILLKIQKKYFFHVFDTKNSIARLMCSYNTSEEDVLEFIEAIKKNV
jgi:threonine aldolase